MLELGHGRGPLHGPPLERVHRGLTHAGTGHAAGRCLSAGARRRVSKGIRPPLHTGISMVPAGRPRRSRTVYRRSPLAVTIEHTSSAGGAGAAASPRQKARAAIVPAWLAPYLQAAPLAVILGLFLLLPLVMIVVVSFWDYDFATMYPDFILLNYEETL